MAGVKVVQEEGKEVPAEVIALSILSISDGVKKLRRGRLNEKALVLLIQHAAPAVGKYPFKKVGAAEVRAVLKGIEDLEATFLNKAPAVPK